MQSLKASPVYNVVDAYRCVHGWITYRHLCKYTRDKLTLFAGSPVEYRIMQCHYVGNLVMPRGVSKPQPSRTASTQYTNKHLRTLAIIYLLTDFHTFLAISVKRREDRRHSTTFNRDAEYSD